MQAVTGCRTKIFRGKRVEERGTRFFAQKREDAVREGVRKTFRLPLRVLGDFRPAPTVA